MYMDGTLRMDTNSEDIGAYVVNTYQRALSNHVEK